MINYSPLTKAQVLSGLYNRSQPQGMGFVHYDPTPMTVEEAEELLQNHQHFDYLKGRVMKISLKKDNEFEEWAYDRDNGTGAAQKVVDNLLSDNKDAIAKDHAKAVKTQAHLTLNRAQQETRTTEENGISVTTLGLADVKQLRPAINKVLDNN